MVIVLIRNGTVTPYRVNVSTLLPGPATASVLGTIRLTGDLGGTATAPTVPGLTTRAPINNAALTGAPTAPTPPSGDNNTRLATTAWVRTHINNTGINALSDVTIATPVIGQGLVWNGTNWVNATASGGGDLLALNNLDDVNNTQTALNNLIDGDNNIHTTGTIRWSTNIANIGGLPPANTYRGMFAAVNGAGGAYYSNGTEWLRLDRALLNDLNDVNTAGVTDGQVLAYQSGNWVPTTPTGSTFTSPLTTKGDLHTYSTTDARLPIGANGTFLVADSTTTTGLRWQAPANTDDIAEGTTNLYYTDARVTTRFNTLIPAVAKGDILVQGATVLSRLPVGSNGQVLLADSTTATGLRWGAVNSEGGTLLASLSDVAITSPAQGQVLTWNATTSKWNATNLSNQVSLNRQTLTGALTLTLSSAGTQHLDPGGTNRDVLLPLNPTVGTRFRILNLAPAFNILVKNPNTSTTVLTLGNSTSIQAEFIWNGVDWYSTEQEWPDNLNQQWITTDW